MKIKRASLLLLILLLVMLFPLNSQASGNWYYGSGNYVSSAPIKPTTGLKFYVDYSAIKTYGSEAFTVPYDWNGSYQGHIAAVAKYPALPSLFPGYFLITTDGNLSSYITAEIFYYSSDGELIGGTYPMDSTSIYKCSISLNSDRNVFKVNGLFSANYLEKVIRHEIGHVFLLKHPSNLYFSSVMHQESPNGSTISATVTTDDRKNIKAKWGDINIK